MKKLSPIAYVPRRETVQSASLAPVALYLGSYLLVSFFSSDPLVLIAATAGAALAGYGCGAGKAVRFSLRLGAFLAVSMVIINALVTGRGATVLARLGDWPLLGQVDVTAEAIAAGGVIALRVLGTMVVIGVWSACVDPDRILQAVHGVARRSALTATLISRLVPLAATDYARIGEAAETGTLSRGDYDAFLAAIGFRTGRSKTAARRQSQIAVELIEAVASYWQEAGLAPKVEILEFGAYLDVLFDRENRADAIFVSSSNDILDPDRQLSTYYQAGGIGSSNSNQEMSDLIDQGRSELDATVREGIYQEAVKIAYDEAYFVWTVNNQDVYGASEGLQWTPRVDSKILVKEMSLS